jgi:hypothetical protein
MKENFNQVVHQNSQFRLKVRQDMESHNKKFEDIKGLIKQLENKTVRIDKTISEHELELQNYMISVEHQKWIDKHKEEQEKEEVSMAIVQKMENYMEEVALKVHRHSDDQLEMQDKLGDLETKIILLIQAAKNSIEGKDITNIFDGIGDVVSAVDYFKEFMKSQYAKLTEFKETENLVDSLNRFKAESQENRVKELKEKEELLDKIEDLKLKNLQINKELNHMKNDRFKNFEDLLLEKLDYGEFEATVANIQSYIENLHVSDGSYSPPALRARDSSNFVIGGNSVPLEEMKNEEDSLTDEDIEDTKKSEPNSKNTSPTVSREQSRDPTPNKAGNSKKLSKTNSRDQTPNPGGVVKTFSRQNSKSPSKISRDGSPNRPQDSLMKKSTLRKRSSMKKGTSFIPKETARMREFERRIKDLDEKLTNVVKNSKNDIIPIIEKRLNGIREELENKASTLDLKKMLPEITLASETNKQLREEMKKIRENGLIGEKGIKAEEEIKLSSSRLAQLEGKFTWLHSSHKDLIKKMHESLSATQPLMMSSHDATSGVSEVVMAETKKDMDRLQKEISNLASNLRMQVGDLKTKLSEKIDEKTLNELEDQITTDIDQTIRSTLKFH